MFARHDDQEQAGDAIWAEFSEGEEHIGPYPKGAEDNTSAGVEDHNKNDEGANVGGISEHSAAAQSEVRVLEKQAVNQTNAQFSATQLDMESWPDLPSLNPALDRNYCDDNIASTYLDFSAEPSLQKVTGSTTVQLDDDPEVFDNDHEEKCNSFLDCDWGNIGDFDDFDRLFSSSDSIFGNEMVADDSDFLSISSDLMDNIVKSIPTSLVPLDKQPSADCAPSLLVVNEISAGINKQENKVADANARSGEQAENQNHLTCGYSGKQNQFSQEGDAQNRQSRFQRKLGGRGKSEISSNTSGFSKSKKRNPPSSLQPPMQLVQTPQSALFHDGKNMGQVQHPCQFMFPGYGYPVYPFSTIPLVSNNQAQGHQTKPAAPGYRTSTDTQKHSSAIETSKDTPSRPLTMTRQEKIEKLRRRQQLQALIAIQQQQQQFGQVVSGSYTVVPQTYSSRRKNPDSLDGSIVIDENINNVFSPELNRSNHEEVHKSCTVSVDPFIEEKIFYHLRDAVGKLEASTRLCIRESLLRLAHNSSMRQIAGDRNSSNKTIDEDEASENDTTSRRKRSPAKEAETKTNPIDRIVAHLLFHRHYSKVATMTKKEIISSTPLTLEPDSKLSAETLRVLKPDSKLSTVTLTVPSRNQQIEQEMMVQP